jgi:hypothetical protein
LQHRQVVDHALGYEQTKRGSSAWLAH